MSELLWVAVPGGRVADGLATLRALVVPRLAGGPLTVTGMHAWPDVLSAGVLTVLTAAGPDAAPTPIRAERRGEVRADLWPRFFAPGMAVTPWRRGGSRPRPHERARLTVAATATHHDALTEVYGQVARAPGEPAVARAAIGTERPRIGPIEPAPAAPTAGVQWQPPDFHRAVSLLREHPAVLRALGLIVELAVPAAELPPTAPGTYRLIQVTCVPGPGLVGVTMTSPWTRYEYTEDRFVAAAREPGAELARGMVDLSGDDWAVATFDVAGGVDRLRDAIRTIDRSPADAPGALPPLRSVGLQLLRRGRADQLHGRIAAAGRHAALPTLAGAELCADDLVLGYRLDVREPGTADQTWRPLCERSASYYVDDMPIGAEGQPEEGHLKANAAAAVGPDDELRADEVVARWSGWGLALPAPDPTGIRKPAQPAGAMPYRFSWAFTPVPDRPLPQLRFNHSYQLRARVADMAGGGLAHDDPRTGDRYATTTVSYRRHDPIPPPELPPPPGLLIPAAPRQGTVVDARGTVVDHAALGPGGAVDLLVVRSDPAAGLSPDAFGPPAYPRNDTRMLLPPPAPLILAEQHGRLDGIDDRTIDWVRRATAPPAAGADGSYSWLPDPACYGVTLTVAAGPGSPAPDQLTQQAWAGGWPDFQAKTVLLRPVPAVDGQVVRWDPNRPHATVDLGPAEQATLELTSYPDPELLDSFQLWHWHTAGDGGAPGHDGTLITQGRHPMATPPRRLRLVHAVRRPLGVPAGTLAVDRKPGDTAAVLLPSAPGAASPDGAAPGAAAPGDPLLGAHPGSTAQVDLIAGWDEWRDGDPAPTTEQVTSVRLDVAATALPELRHEFGDTRHRRVTYTLRAITRFRGYFPGTPGEVDEPGMFTVDGVFGELRVPSTARPAPPVVLATTPSFRWVDESEPGAVRHRRLGGRLRIELARPWNLSGPGELLAVVVAPGGAGPGGAGPGGAVPARSRPYVSRVRRDPIWATPNPAGTVLAAMVGGAVRRDATLAENGDPVVAMGYAPALAGDRWYADVELPVPAAGSYSPFAGLAVARYQPDSLAGLHLSRVVRTELVQLLPDRTLTVRDTDGQLLVTLDGLGPVRPANRVTAVLERATPGSRVDSAAPTATAGAGAAPAWLRVPGASVHGGLGGQLPPLQRPDGPGPLRLVVRETETYAAGEPRPAANPVAAELTERVVFVDVIPLA